MCGIAGIMHRTGNAEIGREMTAMLHSLKHRGPDSTGYALYGSGTNGQLVMRLKVAEPADMAKGLEMLSRVRQRRAEVERCIVALGARILDTQAPTPYALRYRIAYEMDDLKTLCDHVENVEGVEILSIGSCLELVKDLGDAETVGAQYSLHAFSGTHAIGHVRMATESDVDIRSAHPFWAYPFRDISIVHNGQLTNYWAIRRDLERRRRRFASDCDSELIAVYLADRIEGGQTLKDAMRASVEELDGVFTYVVATHDSLGMAKDTMAAKPMVLYEDSECVVLASEEVAIRSVIPKEIATWDPYEGEVCVWRN